MGFDVNDKPISYTIPAGFMDDVEKKLKEEQQTPTKIKRYTRKPWVYASEYASLERKYENLKYFTAILGIALFVVLKLWFKLWLST